MAEKIRTLSLDEIVEEYNKETTLELNFVGAEDDTGFLLFELVTQQRDGSTTGEMFRTDVDMDTIGVEVFGDILPE